MSSLGTALVTGATSGLGYEVAAQLADKGFDKVIVTGRTTDRAEQARQSLVDKTGKDVFTALALDLNDPEDVKRAAAEIASDGEQLSVAILNAGMVAGSKLVKTDQDVEITFSSSLIGHHQLTMELLAANMLTDDAAIVIAGSEAARGDVPTFNPTDLKTLADKSFGGDMTAAAEGLIRGNDAVKYKPATVYTDAKVFVAWWAAQLATRLPEGMTVNAVSPGSAPDTLAARNANFFMKHLMIPVFKHAPKRLGMAAPVPVAAARYIEVATSEDRVTGKFFASAPKKMTGPIEVMHMPHFGDTESQEAAWAATVKVAGGIGYPVTA